VLKSTMRGKLNLKSQERLQSQYSHTRGETTALETNGNKNFHSTNNSGKATMS
jgi:hypothetical protein